jgi:5-methylcytosine-specific restriction endonuclease McrA
MLQFPIDQSALWCACGRSKLNERGVCPVCARRERLSRERFGGLRDFVLARDGYRAQCCGAIENLLVHHRRRGRNQQAFLISLCRACHTRIHHTLRPGFAFPPTLRDLWREQHPDLAEQLLLALTDAGAPASFSAQQPRLFEAA